ncbi:Hypothetical protein HVR_LOCUS445 [uncultured virus]|nr:Hypothetical protein HVR_LOCUS445 [uncultured virus]
MNKSITIEHTPESFFENGKALIGHCCFLTGKKLALINLEGWSDADIEKYQNLGLVINSNGTFIGRKYKPPKKAPFHNKIQQIYELLESFIENRCEFSNKYSIPATILLNEFLKEIDQPINSNKEFPTLMKKLMDNENFSCIDKKTTSKGIIYTGLRLKSHNILPQNIRQSIINVGPPVSEDVIIPNFDKMNLYQPPIIIPSVTMSINKPLTLFVNNLQSNN